LVSAQLAREARGLEEAAGAIGVLAVALNPRDTSWREVMSEFARDTAHEVEAVGARAERERGLIVGNAFGQDTAYGDIGRIDSDSVKASTSEGLEEVADLDMRTRGIEMILVDIFLNRGFVYRVDFAEIYLSTSEHFKSCTTNRP
jgi:hypothetical protein